MTRRFPKCLAIVLNGKPLLETQLDTLRSCGITDISIVRGYRANTIRYPNVHYLLNTRYRHTDQLASLACAEAYLEGTVLISFADIWYDASVVKRLLACRGDIVITVDVDWRRQYRGRTEHPVSQADQVIFTHRKQVRRIGKFTRSPEAAQGEFIGLMKLSPRGCQAVRAQYHLARRRYHGKRFHGVPRFESAQLIDLLQEMVDRGTPVHCHTIRGGWMEIDTRQDYERALTRLPITRPNRNI